ncbi:hypothetical protein F5X99DRAFT_61449 [Biscogniauxia marginata]|nr:hypothetical protein F5X99DRAFT_61449 [Biscogniauxia marginata]
MGRPPAYIFVVRHGNRLDAADKQWHLSSPTPYDPPLTYGGWLQSKAVGAQIASILREQEALDSAHLGQRRRYHVVLHSSPFLRCVQTSIAISAGLASNPSPLSDPAPSPADVPPASPEANRHIEKSLLRLDAFLGEWLSPDYFEHITPPPNSSLMLATAKAELLRREDYYDYPHLHDRIPPTSSTQLWSASHPRESSLSYPVPPNTVSSSSLDSVSTLVETLPSYNGDSHGGADPKTAHGGPSDPAWARTYVAPVPAYALSSSGPIPKGYVAHARDACVDIDYQWDSTRDNLAWGGGGHLPEEWAAMHQRFRKGLKRLVDWYTTTENPGERVTKTPASPDSVVRRKDIRENQQIDTEEVVILVSHGAGCNALIGAITHQPVLADVAMSSLTMAKRRPQFDRHTQSPTNERSASSLDDTLLRRQIAIPDMYELKLFASVDHLHSAVNSPAVSRSSSLAHDFPRGRPSKGFTSALKDINFGSSLLGVPAGGSRSNSASASLGSMRRSSGGPALTIRQSVFNNNNNDNNNNNLTSLEAGSRTTHLPSTRQNRSGSVGLWTPIHEDSDSEKVVQHPIFNLSHQQEAKRENDEVEIRTDIEHPGDVVPNRISLHDVHSENASSEASHDEEHDTFDEATAPRLWAGTGSRGLWGAPRPPGEAERLRDFTSTKRRWTVNERER